jgi:hypothetical protein
VLVWTNKDLTEQDRALLRASVQAVVQKEGGAQALLDELRTHLAGLGDLQALRALSRQGGPAEEPAAPGACAGPVGQGPGLPTL